MMTTAIVISGVVNWKRRFEGVALRHAISGPTPVRNSSVSPIGTIHRLKNGADTVMRSWNSASDSVGNIVANSMKNAANSRIQLFDEERRLARQPGVEAGARSQLGHPVDDEAEADEQQHAS